MVEVEHWQQEQDGTLTESALRRKLEARGYVVTTYRYPAGTCFAEHSHTVDKIDAVLSGRFRLVMAGAAVILNAGDCVQVPKGVRHSAEVIGEETVVSLDAVKL
jgi:quercetin dioxygenase-like cupin family protein